ncbi:hypothetical protein Tco_0258012, partial [Tanacetum coccineum]
VGERILEVPKMIEVTNEKVAVAREKLKEAQTRQKSYADRHRRALEFQPSEHVFLKVSQPTRGVRRFGIKGKLSPRFIGPFEILDVALIREDLSYTSFGGIIPSGKLLGRPRSLYGLLILIFFHDLVCSFQSYHVSISRTKFFFRGEEL